MVDVPVHSHRRIRCGQFELGFGADGAIRQLFHDGEGHSDQPLADATHPLARIHYQNMDAAYFKRYVNEYIAGVSEVWPELTAENLFKPGLDTPAISSNASLLRLRRDNSSSSNSRVLLDLCFDVAEAHTERGAPAALQAELRCGSDSIAYTLRTFGKPATHTPETLWLSHVPVQLADLQSGGEQHTAGRGRVKMDKLGSAVDPLSVDLSAAAPGCADPAQKLTCGVHLHGVGRGGVVVVGANSSGTTAVRLASEDSALVSIGVAEPVPTPLVAPNVAGGVHFALVGNIW